MWGSHLDLISYQEKQQRRIWYCTGQYLCYPTDTGTGRTRREKSTGFPTAHLGWGLKKLSTKQDFGFASL